MKYNIEEMRSKISRFGSWEKEMKEKLFNEMVSLLFNEAMIGKRPGIAGNKELELTVKPKGYLVSMITGVTLTMFRGNHAILYRTAKMDYDYGRDGYWAPSRIIQKNGMALSAYIDLYEAILETLKEKKEAA